MGRIKGLCWVMALALTSDILNLNPGHTHYVNLGKLLNLNFIFLIYKNGDGNKNHQTS